MVEGNYEWTEFYMNFANKLLEYKDNREELVEMMLTIYNDKLGTLPKPTQLDGENGEPIDPVDIDPFSIFSFFNRGITDKNRISIIKIMSNEFQLDIDPPSSFDGIPKVSNQQSLFYDFKDRRDENDINNLWRLFNIAIKLSDDDSPDLKNEFVLVFDKVKSQRLIPWKITQGLFWIRPNFFVSLDRNNKDYIINNFENPIINKFKELDKPEGENYLDLCKYIRDSVNNIPAFSYNVYTTSNDKNSNVTIPTDETTKKTKSNEETKPYKNEYSKENFVQDAYINEADYDDLRYLLENKLNLIVRGPPGVGKTFLSKKLAYSIIGEKNTEQVMMIQFHQSYSYEDFFMGYKPVQNGFELKNGPFYEFCEKAYEKKEKKYFFIIDEINRGNLSKIFGELFMLIENDKRGDDNQIQLLYSDKAFSIPKNVYIIGLMNTSDKSLARIDYALRRRFAFFDLKPAFDSENFIDYKENLSSEKFNNLIDCIVELNKEIEEDESLGEGFGIGHSFLCNLSKNNVDKILNYIVNYELIPLLKEYWFDDKNKIETWSNKLREAIK